MSLMNPWLMLGALGVSLPIIAHILNKHQFKQTPWAAMQFLNRTVRIRSQQIRLKDILLLLLRCLAILLIVFSISRPAFQRDSLPTLVNGEQRAAVVIALDASYSMQHSNGTNTRFERAIQSLEEICQSIHEGDPVSLVLLADKHEVVVRNMAYHQERFAEVLQSLQATSEPLNMETIPTEISGMLDDLNAIQKEVYILSDVQSHDWKNLSPWMKNSMKELSKKAKVYMLPIQGEQDNVSISDFSLLSGSLRKGTIARYQATVRNHDNKPARNVKIKCIMEGVNVDSKTIARIAPGSAQTVSFFVPFHNSGPVKIRAELEQDALPLDNVRRTVANIRERVSILCVESQKHGTSMEGFIAKALRARGSYSEKEDFKIRSVSWLSLPNQKLSNFDLVILSDVPEITEQQAQQLRDYVKEGRGLIWFGGDNVKASTWNKRSSVKDGVSLLPALVQDVVKVSDDAGLGLPLDPVLRDHPVCRPLRSLPKDLLSEARFDHIHPIKVLPTSRTVLSLSGSETPILIEHSIGRGHVFMFASSSNPVQNNLALTPVFPMILQQMVTYLTGREFEQAQTVGSSLSLSYAHRPDANTGVFEAPSGDIQEVPVLQHGNQYVAMLDRANEAGFYMARVSLQSPGSPIPVNVDTKESSIQCYNAVEAQKDFESFGVGVASSTDDLMERVNKGRNGLEIWRSLMIAGLCLLILESFLASNFWRKERAPASASSEASMQTGGA